MKKGRMDYQLLVTTIALVAFGLLMVFSSSYYFAMANANFNDKMHFVIRDLKWVISGVVIMFVASVLNHKIYKNLAPFIMVLNFMFLIAIYFYADVINGSRRWLFIFGQSFTPSEFSKAAVIFFYAYILSRKEINLSNIRTLIMLFVVMIANSLLIYFQPDYSTSILLMMTCFAMVFIAGLKWRYIIGSAIVGLPTLLYFASLEAYRWERITSFLKPIEEQSGQILQSIYAISSGGLLGVGLTQSTANKLYLPEPQTDFILATVGEEFGFFGMILLLLCFLVIIYRCFKVAINAPDKFSSLLAFGVGALISIQVIMNYFVTIKLMPVTGIPLPFISYGGNSKVIMLFLIGVVLNISRYQND